MFLWCERCQIDFLPRRGFYLSRCPRCGREQPTGRAQAKPHAEPLRLAVRNRAPWVPRWIGTLAGLSSVFIFINFGHAWVGWLFTAVGAASLVASAIWRWAKRTMVLEVGQGRIAASWQLEPWPGRWIPASAVWSVLTGSNDQGRGQVVVMLHGEAKVIVVQDVDREYADGLASTIEAAVRSPAPALPEVHCSGGEREARVEWNCGRAVSVAVDSILLSVKCAGRKTVALDTDFVDAVRVEPESNEVGIPRFRLVAATRKGATEVLLEGEPAREPLEVVAREIRRVLRLELPAKANA